MLIQRPCFSYFQKQVTQYNKVVGHVYDIANKAREEWEGEAGARASQVQTSSAADTHSLVAAVGMGKGLKVIDRFLVKRFINFSLISASSPHFSIHNPHFLVRRWTDGAAWGESRTAGDNGGKIWWSGTGCWSRSYGRCVTRAFSKFRSYEMNNAINVLNN